MLVPVNMGRPLAHSNASRPASLAAVRRFAACSDAEATLPALGPAKGAHKAPGRPQRRTMLVQPCPAACAYLALPT